KVVTFDWQHRVIGADGKSHVLKDGEPFPLGYRPVEDYLTFSPRRVILKPKQRQVIRFIAKRPQGMEPGEYRSHFLINEEALVNAKPDEKSDRPGLSGLVVVNVSKSVPVFLRQGEMSVNVTLNDINLYRKADGSLEASYSITNNSTRSLYGHIEFVCPQAGADPLIEGAVPLRLYAEYKNVKEKAKVKNNAFMDCPSITARIVPMRDKALKGQILSERQVQITR
ncbi:MAG: hypothetical protein ACPGRX_08405, partial [Bdellovibrionales bacterium]